MGLGQARVRGVVGYKRGDSEGSVVLKPYIQASLTPPLSFLLSPPCRAGLLSGFWEARNNHVGGVGVDCLPRNR